MDQGWRRPVRGLGRLLAALVLAAAPLAAAEGDEPAADESEPRYNLGIEVKAHYRDSDFDKFPLAFPLPPEFLPPGAENAYMTTVDVGNHTEVSMVTVEGRAHWRDDLEARVKVDIIDRYDRNPTSEDRDVDVDELWLRFGRELEPGDPPAERRSYYAKLGKFPKFERQDDRHLESYGLVSTSFNRFEDIGVELGADLGSHVYVKASFTQGNPLFFRDPNVLAGDNGIQIFNPSDPDFEENPVADLGSGFPIFYDADVDEIDFEHPEIGLGLGARFGDEGGFWALDALLWGYERELAEEAQLDNTFYGGDIDLLLGPFNSTPLIPIPVVDDTKREIGANLWLYAGGFSLFGQWVDQEIAGLDRTGFEVEAAWSFELPLFGAVAGRQLFSRIQPAVRYSELKPDFALDARGMFPAPSVVWDWEKLDVGLRIAVLEGIELTVEWQDTTFFLLNGEKRPVDEFLVTLALDLDRDFR